MRRIDCPIGFLVLALAAIGGCGLPSDKELLSLYEAKKDTFERLRRMSLENRHLSHVGTDSYSEDFKGQTYSAPSTHLSAERWAGYRSLLIELSSEASISRGPLMTNTIWFPIAYERRTWKRSCKGVCFSTVTVEPLCESLDGPLAGFRSYRRINEHWYMYLDQ